MMFNTASAFIFSVFTLYTFYRYILQQNQFFKELALLHFMWQIYYLSNALIVIYISNRVTNEVNSFSCSHHFTQYFEWLKNNSIFECRVKILLKSCMTYWTVAINRTWNCRYVYFEKKKLKICFQFFKLISFEFSWHNCLSKHSTGIL